MVFGILRIIGVVLFLYLVWRKLREDYKEELLIVYSWWALLFVFIGGRVTFGMVNWGVWNDNLIDWLLVWQKPGFNYLGGLIGLMVVTVWYCKENDWKIWSFLESITDIVYLSMFFLMASIGAWLHLGVMLVGCILAWFTANKYRSFVWYKSGKKGFIFFFVNLIVGVLLAIVSWWLKDGPIVIISYLSISLISGLGLFMLANE